MSYCGSAFADLNIEIEKATPAPKHKTGEVDLNKTSASYSVIEAEKIQGRYADLTSVIENEVGVQVRSFGGFGSFSTAVLRGASSEQVIVYLDGVALNDAATGSFDLSSIPVDNIERIEVYRGVTPIELGNASIGGAINIITKKTSDRRFANLKMTVGSLSTEKLSASYNEAGEKDNILISADYFQSDNDYEIVFDNGTSFNAEDDFLVKVNNDQVKQSSALLKWNTLLAKETDLDTRIKAFDKDKGIPSKNNSPDVITSYDTNSYDFLTQLTTKNINHAPIDVNIKLALTSSDQIYDDQLAQLGFIQQKIKYESNRQSLQSYALHRGESNQLKVVLAAAKEDFSFRNELVDREKSKNNRDILEMNLEYSSFFLYQSLITSFAYRYQGITDHLDYAVNSFGVESDQSDKKYTVSDPQIGMRYKINGSVSLAANIGRYTRIPTFIELFGNQGLFRGNEELQLETSVNSDMGVTYTFFKLGHWLDETSMYFGLFHNESDNLIVRSFNALGIGVSENLDKAVINGLEYQVKFYPAKSFQLNFNMTLLDSTITSSSSAFDEKSLPGQYAQSYSLYINYIYQNWKFSLQQNYKRDMYFERTNSLNGQNVFTADVSVFRRWKDHSLEMQANNITDVNHIQFNSRPLPGAVYLLTYQYYFN